MGLKISCPLLSILIISLESTSTLNGIILLFTVPYQSTFTLRYMLTAQVLHLLKMPAFSRAPEEACFSKEKRQILNENFRQKVKRIELVIYRSINVYNTLKHSNLSQHSVKKYFTKVLKSSVASSSQPNQEANVHHSEVTTLIKVGVKYFQLLGLRVSRKKKNLGKHIGLPNSPHSQSKKKCQDLLRVQQSIHFALEMQFSQFKHAYWVRLSASVDVVKLLITQGLAFRDHDESKSSLSRVDESFDVSRKEQMAIVLRYIDRNGFVMERLLDIVHVQDTSALSLKRAIANLLAQHSLSLSYVCGQCYDRASNMQGEIYGLKMLIRIQEALDLGELTTSRGLNQELDLSRACDTRWGSHFKSFNNFILMFGSILNVLESLVLDARLLDDRAKTMGYLEACRTYEVAFMLHLMSDVLAITNELNKCLQKKEQDLANAMLLVEVAKIRLQAYRDEEWDSLIARVSLFCIKHDILVPNFEEPYVSSLRSQRRLGDNKVSHHYRVEVFCNIIDWQLQELKDHFGEATTDFLHGISCLNPIDSFSSFDIRKLMKMAKLYPDDFNEFNIGSLENQLASYIIDVRDVDERFSNLKGLCDLSKKISTNKEAFKLSSCIPLSETCFVSADCHNIH
ncbi:uncharacterized protein LOC132628788 [Lycium barbarum]|uniref:uncharacterized protein LOC132628788 n=1 Tax=Lycium barbarum TaxID=112863 RepID=UPI00293ECBE4|nr:uncharacterized protein LOC132628788 [Lycium barbarum]